ncbi:hypothetical protein GWK47_051287 [Chionoecetes opilio]|uniref:SH2 domain-containing protein n=1 Tax=Chionoecetes opilio TaxID=41210 RepID=A0A8J5CT97_CHIOP|nr:hypothetical protein GWK47_051287 [Chionoecetes opilio]
MTLFFSDVCRGFSSGDDDFSSDEDEEESREPPPREPLPRKMEPQPRENIQADVCDPPARHPWPIPRGQAVQDEGNLDEESWDEPIKEEEEEDIYLNPIRPDFEDLASSISRGATGIHQQMSVSPNTLKKVPWIATRGNAIPDRQGPGRNQSPYPGDHGRFISSLNKTSPNMSGPPPPFSQRPKLNTRPSLPPHNNQSGAMGGPFLPSSLQESKPNTLPMAKKTTTKGRPWMPSYAQESNDHVYEPVGNPAAAYHHESPTSSGPGRPPVPIPALRNHNKAAVGAKPLHHHTTAEQLHHHTTAEQLHHHTTAEPLHHHITAAAALDLAQALLRWAPLVALRESWHDHDDLISQLGAATLSHKKLPMSALPHIKPRGSINNGLSQPPTPSSPGQYHHNRPPCPIPPKTSPQDGTPPLEPAPLHPQGKRQQFITLDDGSNIFLTELLEKSLEKPYFHSISRVQAKTSLKHESDGSYVIRPSTRTEHPLTLTLKHDGCFYNINIRQRSDCLLALGNEKIQEQAFSSLDELVKIHTREPIKLKNGKLALLKQTPNKEVQSRHILREQLGRGKPINFSNLFLVYKCSLSLLLETRSTPAK